MKSYTLVVLWGLPALAAATPPSGDAQISAPVAGSRIVIKTTSRLAGAIDSITWRGKEFIDSHDHGRQLQSASNFDVGTRFKPETFNPTEAGSRHDGVGPTSTSRLLSISAKGNVLKTRSQMAFWLRPGEKSFGNPAKNTQALSDHLLEKTVTIGAMGSPHVIAYDATFAVPGGEGHTYAQFEVVTGYMPPDFSVFLRLDRSTGKLEPISDGPGEQKDPVVLSTPDGRYAMGVITPHLGKPWRGPGYGRFRFVREKVVKWNAVYRLTDKTGIKADRYRFIAYVPMGTREMVRTALFNLDKQLRARR